MSSKDLAISIRGISKAYTLVHNGLKSPSFREVVVDRLKHPFRKRETETFWALKDVSFDIKRGEVVGIIGRNGAGKSTLLKILSRIVEPTSGEAHLFGRVGSLLEVGTGFHQELTGRENIFLNGAILGMRREEISKQFDAIVDFAEVERFLDTPVKRYSSGMYVRLAFAVAAHLNPEILIVDEVLAVGDAQFQKKCMGKMGDVAKSGRTVLFVSHNMSAVEQLCNRIVWLSEGQLHCDSYAIETVAREYLFGGDGHDNTFWTAAEGEKGSEYFDLRRIAFESEDGSPLPRAVPNDQPMYLVIEGDVETLDSSLLIGYTVVNADGQTVYWSVHTDAGEDHAPPMTVGRNTLRTRIPSRFLNEGTYTIEVTACLHQRLWILEPGKSGPSITFSIAGGLSDSAYWYEHRAALTAPILRWESLTAEMADNRNRDRKF
jgi:lipopolysaccharide transport system ATP-binding protein